MWTLLSKLKLTYGQQLHIKHQRRIRRNHPARAACAVAEICGDDQRALPADLHAFHALIPALDHLPRAKREIEWLGTVMRAVELLALVVGRGPAVHHAGG